MKTKRKKKLQKEVPKHKKYSIAILLILLAIIIIQVIYINDNKTISNASTIYYTGKIYSANASANMVDYIKTDDNIIISPYNINLQLAAIYNGTETSSRE